MKKIRKWLPVITLVFAAGGVFVTIKYTEKQVDKLELSIKEVVFKIDTDRQEKTLFLQRLATVEEHINHNTPKQP